MAQYFFHLRDDAAFFEDVEGQELAGIEDAQEEAVAVARELLAGRIAALKKIGNSQVEIADATGKVRGVLPLRSIFEQLL